MLKKKKPSKLDLESALRKNLKKRKKMNKKKSFLANGFKNFGIKSVKNLRNLRFQGKSLKKRGGIGMRKVRIVWVEEK